MTFRALHERPGAFIIPNPWDTGSACVLHALGFDALATTSAGLAFSRGLPDGAIGRDEALEHAAEIVPATPLPLSADLENCYGDNPETVAETVRLATATGLAGCSIKDYSGDASSLIYDHAHAVERVAAAVEAACAAPGDFVLTARAENYLHGRRDLDDTLSRLRDFEAAGADVLYAPGLADLGDIRTVCESLSRPVNVVMGLPSVTFGVKELAVAGVSRISVGSALARRAFGAPIAASREMLDEGTFTFAGKAAGFKEIEKLFEVSGGKDGQA